MKYRIKSTSLVLVAGIGNENITADSLGCRVCDGLIPSSNGEIGKLSFVKCGVGGVTGIESHMHLSALSERLKPSIIIVVDTLAANTVERLSSSLQISDKGISPGKGVGNEKKELSFDSMSVPIIAIGVPLVIYAQKILAEYFGTAEALPNKSVNYLKDLVVTSDNIDFIVKDFAKIISESINAAVFGAETA